MENEVLLRKLLRNVRILNVFITLFSIMIITVVVVAGIAAYAVLKEVRDAKESFTSLQTKAEESLDVKSQLCDSSSGSFKTLLENQSDICAN